MQPRAMQPKLTNSPQTITFSEGDGVSSLEVYSTEVLVTSNAGSHNHGSSKVKLKSLVDYNWEPKFYPGQLLAVHVSGKFLAYSIKAPNTSNPGTWNGMVRVVYNPEPDVDRRTLIKGMKGEVQDLAFAHIQKEVVLACIDEMGNFYVHEIEVTENCLKATLIMEVREDTGAGGSTHRVVWCPYIPDEEDEPATDDDAARLLLTTHAHIARMWNVRKLCARASSTGSGVTLNASAALAGGGARAAGEHAAPLLAAAFSPDGSALATAAADGYVMFFQVYMNNESGPRCLHKWQPHDGKPLSSLFFLDNHKNYNSEVQFWKYAVTGADNNTSIKVWSCKSWTCLQSISFAPSVGVGVGADTLGMKAALDITANYLLLADFKARSLYVLHMARNEDDSLAYCKSISEFLLPYPVLSFCIVDAEEIQPKCESSCDDPYHGNGADAAAHSPDEFDMHRDEGTTECSGGAPPHVRLRLYIVQPKGLQEGELMYEPQAAVAETINGMENVIMEGGTVHEVAAVTPLASSILQQQSQQLKNLLMRSQTQPGSLIGQRPESPPPIQTLNLMTPDAFSSPGKREEDDPPLSATPDVGMKQRVSITSVTVVEEADEGAAGGTGDPKPASGGSSPSLEVQQIMGHDKAVFFDDLVEETPSKPEVAEAADAQDGGEPLKNDTAWPQISIAQIAEANQRKASSDKAANQALNAPLMVPLTAGPNPPLAPLNPPPAPLNPPLAPLNPPLAPLNPPLAPLNAPLAPLNPPLAPLNPPVVAPQPDPLSGPSAALLNLAHAPGTAHTVRVVENYYKSKMEALELKVDKLIGMMCEQNCEIRALRDEVNEVTTNGLSGVIEVKLDEQVARTTAAVDTALIKGWERIARVGETASANAAQAAGAGAARALEPLAAAMQHQLAAKLTSTDHLLRENLEKLATSKVVSERLSGAVSRAVTDSVRDALRTALVDVVVPAVEKSMAQMFRQINQVFQAGSKEYIVNVEAAARAAAERGGAAAVAELGARLERHAAALAHHAPLQPHECAAIIKEVTRGLLEKELAVWREQLLQVVQPARAISPPAPTAADRQAQVSQIEALVEGGDENGAFQLALSGADLALVVAACRAADPARVFGPPCRLRQHVLLSLVQQLAADMGHDTALKHRYLEDAVMNLDTSNPVTREHLPIVMRELQKQIVAFITANPGHALTRQFRMLMLATGSLLKSVK